MRRRGGCVLMRVRMRLLMMLHPLVPVRVRMHMRAIIIRVSRPMGAAGASAAFGRLQPKLRGDLGEHS
jgi:hypothetical protein